MPRRSGARPLTAPSASLALASSILIALAALAPNGAAATRSETSTSPEAAVAPAASLAQAEAALTKAAEREAERQARRAERAAATSESQAPAPGTPAAARVEARQAAHALKRAEHAAQREARRSGAAAPASTSAGAQAAAGAKADKTHAERTREHEAVAEQRRREHEARSGRARESKKQREAREAREAAGSEEGGQTEKALGGSGGGGHQAVPAGGVSSIEGGSPTSQAASTSAVASTRTGRALRSTHARTRSRRAAGGSAATAGAGAATLGAGTALAAVGGEAGGAGGGGASHASHRHPSSGKSESTIVRTVTQIVGVIPTALWLLIGVLALAAAAFAVASRMAARRARRLDRQRRALLEDVGLLQAALLPELPERLGPVATSAAYRPASGPGAGGDFYDVFALPEGLLAVIVGDVSGHGREALPHTTLLRYTLRAYMEAGLSPREALRAAAPALERQLGGSFATVVLASWDPRARRLTYSCAGHPHPIVTGLDPSKSIIAASAPPIGAGNATGSRQTVMTIPGAGTACFYTDGVIEARAAGELYGTGRLATALASLRAEHAGTAPGASQLLDRVAAETDRRPDDMAACLLELAGEEEEPRILSEQLLLDAHDAAGKRPRRFLEAAGVSGRELDATLERARTIASERGSALLEIDRSGERPRVSVLQDNIAPLTARALARTQEVAL